MKQRRLQVQTKAEGEKQHENLFCVRRLLPSASEHLITQVLQKFVSHSLCSFFFSSAVDTRSVRAQQLHNILNCKMKVNRQCSVMHTNSAYG